MVIEKNCFLEYTYFTSEETNREKDSCYNGI